MSEGVNESEIMLLLEKLLGALKPGARGRVIRWAVDRWQDDFEAEGGTIQSRSKRSQPQDNGIFGAYLPPAANGMGSIELADALDEEDERKQLAAGIEAKRLLERFRGGDD